jgi:hypothetical protein
MMMMDAIEKQTVTSIDTLRTRESLQFSVGPRSEPSKVFTITTFSAEWLYRSVLEWTASAVSVQRWLLVIDALRRSVSPVQWGHTAPMGDHASNVH